MMRKLRLLVAAFVLVGSIVGCSNSAKKEYSLPGTLCGISVDERLVSKFLPGGKQVRTTPVLRYPGYKDCRVYVDGKYALGASIEWWQGDDKDERAVAIRHVLRARPRLKGARSNDHGKSFVNGIGGVLASDCSDPGHSVYGMYVVIESYRSPSDDSSAMRKLLASYEKGIRKSKECTHSTLK